MPLPRRARSVEAVNLQPHIVQPRIAVLGLAVASLAVASASSAGQVRHHPRVCYGPGGPRRAGGISEMVSCGSHGVSGARVQFVEAVTRPVDRSFLWQLPH
jgi:hypothetical protein